VLNSGIAAAGNAWRSGALLPWNSIDTSEQNVSIFERAAHEADN